MQQPAVGPFPWHQLTQVSRSELILGRAAAHWWRSEIGRAPLEAALQDLFGLRLQSWGIERARASAALPPSLGADVQLEGAGTRLSLSVEPALVTLLISRVVETDAGVSTGAALPENLRGAFHAIVAELGRRATLNEPLAVTLARPSGATWQVDFWVRLEGRGFRGCAGLRLDKRAPRVPLALRSSSLPVRLPLVIASVGALASEIGSLRVGDGFLFGPEVDPALTGRDAVLCGADSERGLGVRVEARGAVLRGPCDLSYESPAVAMSGSEEQDITETTIAEAPVMVRVELGSVSMSVAEWLSLRPGDVVTSEQPIGSPAVLRVAGRRVAEGELVNVEGSVGVRITRLYDDPSAT